MTETPAAHVTPPAKAAAAKAQEQPVAPPAKAAAAKAKEKPAAPPAKTAAAKPHAPAPAAPQPVAKAPAASPPAQAAAPRLDLTGLEKRLKDSDAIGVMTKLSLKNQVDDLVERFRAYHAGSRPPTLDQLRPSFDLLLMKVLSLLQDKDPKLAGDIHASRDAIWSVLADPAKLSQFA